MYIYISHNGRLVVFYDISILVGYLMPKPIYTYILNIYDLLIDSSQVALFLNELELIYLHTFKCFQILLSSTNSFICTQLNGFKYCCQTQITLFVHSTQLNGFKFCCVTLVSQHNWFKM